MAIKFVTTLAGRNEAGFRHEDNDCAVRTLAIAAGIKYADAHKLVAHFGGRKIGERLYGPHKFWPRYFEQKYKVLSDKAYETGIVSDEDYSKYLRGPRAAVLVSEGANVIAINGHVFAAKKNRIYDSNERSWMRQDSDIVVDAWQLRPDTKERIAADLAAIKEKQP